MPKQSILRQSRSERTAASSTKRERFEQAGRFPLKRVVAAVLVVVVIAAGTVVGVKIYQGSREAGGPVVAEGGVTYEKAVVEMSPLATGQTSADTVTLSVAELKDKRIGAVIYHRTAPMPRGFNTVDGNGLPLLAYVAPSGRLVVATSLCEPCRSWDFHIEGNHLVCNACFTRWDLNTLAGVKGGCLDYPPAELPITVEGDLIHVQRADLEAWTPRL